MLLDRVAQGQVLADRVAISPPGAHALDVACVLQVSDEDGADQRLLNLREAALGPGEAPETAAAPAANSTPNPAR